MTDGLDVCYENLAIAVTRLAVEDYIAERRMLDRRPDDPYAAGKLSLWLSGSFLSPEPSGYWLARMRILSVVDWTSWPGKRARE